MSWVKDSLTGIDGISYDVIRILAVVAVGVGIGLEVFVVGWREGKGFDLQAYGIGIGALFLAAGGALRLKQDTEPGLSIKSETTTTETVK